MSKKSLEINPLTVTECHTMIRGSLEAIVDNKEYFYNSHVGPQYSHLTDAGEQILVKSMNALLLQLLFTPKRKEQLALLST